MLIKALCDYSALQENKTPAGYCEQAVHFEILLTPEGKIAAINDLRVPRIIPLKNKKTKTVYDPVMEQLPVRTQKPGIDKNTIEHRPLYIFGLNYDKGTLTPTNAFANGMRSSLRISTHLFAKPILILSVHGNLSRKPKIHTFLP